MNRFVAALVLVAMSFAMADRMFAEDYVLDDQHTSVVFAINHFGYSFCYGMFGRYGGEFSYDPASPADAKFSFTIDAASLDTKSEKRDEHLRGPDFFNVNQFPEIKFVSTSVVEDGETINVTGDLTLHGVTKSITLPMAYMGSGPAPDGKTHLGFSGRAVFNRSDFDMTTYLPKIGDEVTLLISFEGIR